MWWCLSDLDERLWCDEWWRLLDDEVVVSEAEAEEGGTGAEGRSLDWRLAAALCAISADAARWVYGLSARTSTRLPRPSRSAPRPERRLEEERLPPELLLPVVAASACCPAAARSLLLLPVDPAPALAPLLFS